jgi:hypothetical protein
MLFSTSHSFGTKAAIKAVWKWDDNPDSENKVAANTQFLQAWGSKPWRFPPSLVDIPAI